MIDYFAKHTTVSIILCLFFAGLGIYSLLNIPNELLPNFNPPVIAVITPLYNIEPHEAETTITNPIEIALQGMSDVHLIESQTNSNYSIIIVHFDWNAKINPKARQISNITQKYSSILYRYTPGASPIFRFDLFVKNRQNSQLDELLLALKQKISRIEGVGRVSIEGQLTSKLVITLNQEQLKARSIPIGYIYNFLTTYFKTERLGSISLGDKRITATMEKASVSLESLQKIMIPWQDQQGKPTAFSLKSIATIARRQQKETYSRAQRQDSISVAVIKETGANTLSIIEAALEILEQFKKDNPSIQTIISTNDAHYIKESRSALSGNILVGTILTSFFILIFFKQVVPTLVVFISIPLSLFLTFTAMYIFDVSINLLSLAGLSLGIGMVVDSSISSVSNIISKLQEEKGQPDASIIGTKQIAMPILSSTLTSLAVFVPIVFLNNIVGALFKDLALTIIFALSFSMLISLFIVPSLTAKVLFLRGESLLTRRLHLLDRVGNRFEQRLLAITEYMIHHRGSRNLFLFTIITLITLSFNWMPPLEFIPPEKPNTYVVTFAFPPNTPTSYIYETTKMIEHQLYQAIEIEDSNFTISQTETKLVFKPRTALDLVALQESLQPILTARVEDARMSINSFARFDEKASQGRPLELKIAYQDERDLAAKEKRVVAALQSIPTVREIRNLSHDKAAIITIAPRYPILETRQIPPLELKNDLLLKSMELPITTQIFLRTNESIAAPAAITAANQNYQVTPLQAKQNLFHHNVSSVAFLTANFDSMVIPLSTVMQKIKAQIPEPWLIFTGSSETITKSFNSLIKTLILSIILIYAILAIQFGSIVYPFTILFTFFLTFLGAIPGLLICDEFTSAPATIGIIMLAGITVNNGILLVDHIIIQRKKFIPPHTAILEAIKARIAPILITSLTTITGMVPMVLGLGTGSEIYRGLAVVLVFGLFVSTFLSLIGVPIFFISIEELFEFVGRLRIKTAARLHGNRPLSSNVN